MPSKFNWAQYVVQFLIQFHLRKIIEVKLIEFWVEIWSYSFLLANGQLQSRFDVKGSRNAYFYNNSYDLCTIKKSSLNNIGDFYPLPIELKKCSNCTLHVNSFSGHCLLFYILAFESAIVHSSWFFRKESRGQTCCRAARLFKLHIVQPDKSMSMWQT